MIISNEELEILTELAERLRSMAHPLRLMIISVLKRGECSVTELAKRLDLPIGSVSQHLKIMEHAGLLGCERRGRQAIYRIQASMVSSVCNAMCQEIDLEIQGASQRHEIFRRLKKQLHG